MSQWTHVAGTVRLDSIGMILVGGLYAYKRQIMMEAIQSAFGITCDFDSPVEVWDDCSVPCGSEGSLQYRIVPNSEEETHNASWGSVVIWGDLRDFGHERVGEIADWLEEALRDLRPQALPQAEGLSEQDKLVRALGTFSIRQAVLLVEVERGPRLFLTFDEETGKVVSTEMATPPGGATSTSSTPVT